MTLQQFAKQRNLKIKQLRELCQELFENIPETLSPENMEVLDKALLLDYMSELGVAIII
ncbi:MAG: hypothetical protein ACKO86_24465 [Dolichospermum sp.]